MARPLRPSRLVWLAAALAACNGIVGIEDLHEGPRSGANTGADAGDGGTSSAGKSANGGTGGTGTNPEGGSEPIGGVPGNAGEGPVPMGGDGAGGSPEPAGSTVAGHVIDMWGHKLPNIPVRIGDAVTSTDEDGAFEIEDVPATYDVSLVATFTFNTVNRIFAYVYQGMSRRDPTLQVVKAYAPTFGKVLITQKDAVVGANQSISVAIGGLDGNDDLSGLTGAEKTANVSWEGTTTTQATAYGLLFQQDNGFPTSYLAYDFSPVSLAEDVTTKFTLDLKNETIDSGVLQGTVTPASNSDRANFVYQHFASGATMTLIEDAPGDDTFSYLVPSIPGSTTTVVATEGHNSGFPDDFFALTRVCGLSPTSKPELKIPRPVALTTPLSNATNVTTKTKFTFQPAANPGPYVIEIDYNVLLGGMYIITTETQVTIPESVAGDFKLDPNTEYAWHVTTNGQFASVDAMASPDGFFQPFEDYSDVPAGPQQNDGEFTRSFTQYFTTAP